MKRHWRLSRRLLLADDDLVQRLEEGPAPFLSDQQKEGEKEKEYVYFVLFFIIVRFPHALLIKTGYWLDSR